MKADECISDVVTKPQTVDKTSCCVEHRLELTDQLSRPADEYTITVIQYRVYQCDHQYLDRDRERAARSSQTNVLKSE